MYQPKVFNLSTYFLIMHSLCVYYDLYVVYQLPKCRQFSTNKDPSLALSLMCGIFDTWGQSYKCIALVNYDPIVLNNCRKYDTSIIIDDRRVFRYNIAPNIFVVFEQSKMFYLVWPIGTHFLVLICPVKMWPSDRNIFIVSFIFWLLHFLPNHKLHHECFTALVGRHTLVASAGFTFLLKSGIICRFDLSINNSITFQIF